MTKSQESRRSNSNLCPARISDFQCTSHPCTLRSNYISTWPFILAHARQYIMRRLPVQLTTARYMANRFSNHELMTILPARSLQVPPLQTLQHVIACCCVAEVVP